MSGDELTFSSRYKLDVKLGSGGMGAVYRAYDCVLKKNVAVKLLLPSLNQNMAVRFQQEAKTSAKLDHPNIIRVLDFGQTDKGECYLIMEYLQGQTLEQIVQSSGPLDVNSALTIFEQICLGMNHAHSHGVLHRDVKPSNIMINEETKHATIVDFGVAKFLSDDMHLTGRGKPLGSPAYMSPEQAQGQDVDLRSDLYSMGCVMYFTLIGKPPLFGSTSLETIKKQIEEQAPLLNDDNKTPKFSNQLEEVVEKALEKDPDDRFKDFAELNQSISELKKSTSTTTDETQPSALPPTATSRVTRWQKPLLIALATVAVLVPLFVALDAPGILSTPKAGKDTTPDEFTIKHPCGYLLASPHWLLASGNLHKKGLNELVDYKAWQRLILVDPQLSDTDLNRITILPLVALDLSHTRVTPAGLSLISLPSLKCLILNDNPQITDDSIAENFEVFRKLNVLALRNTSITDEGVKQLSKIKSLHCLDLEQLKGVTPKSLEYLSELKNLRCLKISGTAISTKDIEKLLRFPSLRYVSFAHKEATDETFDTLMKLSPRVINVSNSQITDKSLDKLLKINYPVIVEVNGCPLISKKQVLKVRQQFPPDDRLIDRIQSDFYGPSAGCELPDGDGNPRCVEDSLWYEPNTYGQQPVAGYPAPENHLEHVANFIKNRTNKSKSHGRLSPFFDDIDSVTKEIDDGIGRHKDDILK